MIYSLKANTYLLLIILFATTILTSCGDPDSRATGIIVPSTNYSSNSKVFFMEPQDNDVIPMKTKVIMDVSGLIVEPAGEIHDSAGHLHILVDTDFIPAGEKIPFSGQHLHFGDGSMETELHLEPGAHTLRLQFADGHHMAFDPAEYGDEITVMVQSDY